MEKKQEIFVNCHQLLKDVLLDAFNVPVVYFTPPYTDIKKIDQGIRAAVWTNYNDQNSKFHFSDLSHPYRILIVKSNLGFYNVLASLSAGDKPDFLSIGPFRNEELSPDYFTQVLKEAQITPAMIQGMKSIYESMPFVQVDAIVNVTKHILGTFIPEFKDITPELVEFADQKRPVKVNVDLIEHNFIKFSEQYYELLFIFLKYIKCGDSTRAKKALQTLLHETKLTTNKNMRDFKSLLKSLNDYCHMALLETSLHPSHILRQAASLGIKIDNITSLAKSEQMLNEICRKYCLLVKNYANPDYSKITKDVIAYVQVHIDEELSLNHLASHFNKNPSVLSNIFSKETGQTLTKFVQQMRIQEAIRLFHTTNMSVSEVALAVGYQDFSYFSKVFSKNIGSSPREYKKRSLAE